MTLTTEPHAQTAIIERMVRKGLRPDTISELTGIAKGEIKKVVTTYHYHPDDQEIISEARKLALKVITEAMIMMDRGMPETKLQVMRSFLPVMARMIGQVQDEEQEELKGNLETLFESQRNLA